MQKKIVSLQLSLFRNLAAGPVVLGVTLFAISLLATSQLRKTFAAEITGRIIAETETSFVEYLRPVQEIVELGLQFGKDGRYESQNPEDLDAYFGAMLETVHQVSSIHVAKESGDAYMLLKQADGSYYNRLYATSDPGFIRTRQWTGPPDSQVEPDVGRLPSDYDSRERGWFQSALARLEEDSEAPPVAVWSDPYTFFTTKEPGITTSVAYRTPSGQVEILAFDILLSDILEFARQSQMHNSGIVFVLLRHPGEDDLEVLALPSESLTGQQGMPPTEFPIPVSKLNGAPQTFVQAHFLDGKPVEGQAVRFGAEGVPWWGAAALSPLSAEREIWIVATIPQSEVLSGVPNTAAITLLVLLLTVGLMVLRARGLARRYGDPIGELVDQTERMRRLNFSRETTIESPIHEVQALASSQDAMRVSLSALTAMNDHEAMAEQLRTLPVSMAKPHRSGRWVTALGDFPAKGGGGCFPLVFAASKKDGHWGAPRGDQDTNPGDTGGVLLILVSSTLYGMRAAEQAAALRATTRALLLRWTTPDQLIESLRYQLQEATGTTVAVPVVVAHLDGPASEVAIYRAGDFPILWWHGRKSRSEWVGDVAAGSPENTEHFSLKLAAEDRVILGSETLFDVLSKERVRFSRHHLEPFLEHHARSSAEQITLGLREELHTFTNNERPDVDLAVFAIGPMDDESFGSDTFDA